MKKPQLAHPKRRWKVVPKQELDGGVLTPEEREASEMRKRNNAIRGRQEAAKKRKVNAEKLMSPTPEASKRQSKAAQTAKGESKGVHEIAFPIIASAIERVYRRDLDKFISKREIVPFLLRDAHSRELIETLYKRTNQKLSIEGYAGNQVQWFSQRWTEDDEKWSSLFSKFERSDEKIDGCWAYKPLTPSAVIVFPDEVEEEEAKRLSEGAVFQRLVNAYERNPEARQQCIKKYGTNCYICGFSFGAIYGKDVDGLIHIHHLLQLSKVGKNYKVDPIADLRPVCPNCHAVIHHRNPIYSIEEVQFLVAKVIIK